MAEKKIVNRYYTLEINADKMPVGVDTIQSINANCKIDKVVVNPVYAKNQIVNRTRSNEISYYRYHQWAVRPSEALTVMIQEFLVSSGLFTSISANQTWLIPDLRFRTYVKSLELIEAKKNLSAHINLEFTVTDNSDDKIILIHKADTTVALKQNDLNIFSVEVSNIICQELNIFSEMIKENRLLFATDH